MQRRYSPDHTLHADQSLAREHSTPFSDLRADPDVRVLRLWFDTKGDGKSWKSLDLARGGLSAVNRLRTSEYADTEQNNNLLRQVARSAFTLYQYGKFTDTEANLVAIALPRRSSLHLGHMPGSHFDALRGNAISADHLGIFVDDDDMLAIEAYNIENIPQVEVIAADSEIAVQSGLAQRNYFLPARTASEGIAPLRTATTIPPQFIPSYAMPIPVEHVPSMAR